MTEQLPVALEEKNSKMSRVQNAVRAVLTGMSIGALTGLVSENAETAITVGSYLALRRIVGRYMQEKPLWLSGLVDVGLAVPPLVILDTVLQHLEKSQPLFDQLGTLFETIEMSPNLVEIVRNLPDLIQTAPELAVYGLFFFLFTQNTLRRALRTGLGRLKNTSSQVVE